MGVGVGVGVVVGLGDGLDVGLEVGDGDGPTGVTDTDAGSPVPYRFFARTWYVYCVPLVRPLTSQVVLVVVHTTVES